MKKKNEKIKEAAALKYEYGDRAPKVVAAGKGKVAENIIKTADEHDVPVHTDPELAHMLNLLELGDEIPPELYEVVAQILIFVSDLDKLKHEVGREDGVL
ncbi:MAG: EscU/YscU/HrcU family type III secretion system export apparatus switch protein [Firmicutes bacterium]|nr:EscU/YscU/HrcU family type III secretion system export apparatus switch protein [Bacillota bacterium]